MTIEVPKVPNFLRTSDGQTVPLCRVTDDGLRALATQWTKDLLARSQQQSENKKRGIENWANSEDTTNTNADAGVGGAEVRTR